METIIVLCLLIIIVLLVQDKIVIKKQSKKKSFQEKVNPYLPDIMGQPKPVTRHSLPNTANERQIKKSEVNPDNLDIAYDENETVGSQVPQEEPDEVFSTIPDLEEEEEEWNRHGISAENKGFAQGVTFEELSAMGMLLQKDKLEPSQKETAAAIVQKLQGTELFSLLENSMEGASQKMTELLDSTLSSETEAGSSILRNNDLDDFDIGEFV
ncbi:conjugal transfer protein TraD [Empedobacter brevis]|uniref:conjugal transfer protein TraD n=1 Tax=Empedobacter brevis TaxID=247 RepID=UPI00131FE573|nr:conjugal transfer protein TraD [Empedobacter brevis]QHC84732.1 conjugal transfer protein TraD [Empedobacter brevis]